MKYNYVILLEEKQIYRQCYLGLCNSQNIRFVQFLWGGDLKGVLKRLYQIHSTPRINKHISLPFRSLWNYCYLPELDFADEKPIVFLFTCRVWTGMARSSDYISYLRKKYPACKCVLFLMDLVSTQTDFYTDKVGYTKEDMEQNKRMFDLVVSFDPIDCKKYNLVYHPNPYTPVKELPKSTIPDSDVFFCGRGKNRQELLFRCYDAFKAKGLKVDFLLSEIDEKDRIHDEGITYVTQIDYDEYLQHVAKTKCLLEIMQKDAVGYSLRTHEAVCYSKKLITNNPCITELGFYNPQYMTLFQHSDASDLDVGFLSQIKETINIDYKYNDEFSPIKFIQFIEDRLP